MWIRGDIMYENITRIPATILYDDDYFNRKLDLRVVAYVRVSTDDSEQKKSYDSMIKYYSELVKRHPNWKLIKIYADEAKTGTSTVNRDAFNEMMRDAMDGKFDMLITKSITRFARNTLDTIRCARLLKERNIDIFFESNRLHTLGENSEQRITDLSSHAQQQVEETSHNVKMGLAMKMDRGELVGFSGCLGYDYDRVAKELRVNEKEADIVRFIFNAYLQGKGFAAIAKLCMKKGYLTKTGSKKWSGSSIRLILMNEKYRGDVRQGKTFTKDPLTKVRCVNNGESDQYYKKNNHPAIIAPKIFETVQRMIKEKSIVPRARNNQKYTLSNRMVCGHCGSTYIRRIQNPASKYENVVWQCNRKSKGEAKTDFSKSIKDKAVKEIFQECINRLKLNRNDVFEELMIRIKDIIVTDDIEIKLRKMEKEKTLLQSKSEKLLDTFLDQFISKEVFKEKSQEFKNRLEILDEEITKLSNRGEFMITIRKRLNEMKEYIQQRNSLNEFDEELFNQLVKCIIVGKNRENGFMPYVLDFVFDSQFKFSKIFKDANKSSINKKHTLLEFEYEYHEKVINKEVKVNIEVIISVDFEDIIGRKGEYESEQ